MKTAAELLISRHYMWNLGVLDTLSNTPCTHTVRGTCRCRRYGRRLQPLHKKYKKTGLLHERIVSCLSRPRPLPLPGW